MCTEVPHNQIQKVQLKSCHLVCKVYITAKNSLMEIGIGAMIFLIEYGA